MLQLNFCSPFVEFTFWDLHDFNHGVSHDWNWIYLCYGMAEITVPSGWRMNIHKLSVYMILKLLVNFLSVVLLPENLSSPFGGCQAKRHNQAKEGEMEGFLTILAASKENQGSFPKQCFPRRQNWGSLSQRYSWKGLSCRQRPNFN